MSEVERELQPVNPDGNLSEVKEVRFNTPEGTKVIIRPVIINPSPEFQDYAELTRASYSPFKYFEVALVQEIRRHPKLQMKIEGLIRKTGREVNLGEKRT